MRTAWALGVALLIAAAAVAAVRLAPPRPEVVQAAYPLPEPGTVEPIVGPQGAPAFLARDTDGTARAFLAVAPHSGLPLAWCPAEGIFVEPVGSSRFDLAGRYGFGPAPHGLRPYAVEVDEGRASLGALEEPPPRSQSARPPTNPFVTCTATDGYLLGVLPPTAQLPGPVTPAAALARRGWVTVHGALEERAGGQVLCAATAEGCPPSSPGVEALLEGYSAQPGERRVGTFLALVDGSGLAALVAPPRADDLGLAGTIDPGAAAWCGEGTISALQERVDGERRIIDVVVADLRAPTSTAYRCGYGEPPPPEEVLGQTLTLPAAGYADAYTARYAYEGLARDTAQPIPPQGSAEHPAADGVVETGELAALLGLDPPLTGVVRVEDGQLTDLWIPPS